VVHEKTGIEMVFIPAGEFEMGSRMGVSARPAHTVRITKPFYLGRYEVTQEQWQRSMGSNPSYFKGDRNPVDSVSWYDCDEFLSKAGGGLCLPTEAQWEYACRAGTTTPFSFGDDSDDLGRYAWYGRNSEGKTHPVGGKLPNAWGLYDMHGNVWEWCSDWFHKDYYRQSPPDDPQGSSSGRMRVLRGGFWVDVPGYCRSDYRYYSAPAYALDYNGFRVCWPFPSR